jgi:hypothetical protein
VPAAHSISIHNDHSQQERSEILLMLDLFVDRDERLETG